MRAPRAAIILSAWLSGLTAAPFSHRLHVELKLECQSCHAAAATSTRVEDNLLPSKQACVRCHAEPTIPAPPSTLVTRFSHQQHARFGNIAPLIAAAIDSKAYLSPPGGIRPLLATRNACEACHRGMSKSEAVSKAAMPKMADCLVCHTKVDPPFSCPFCHSPDAQLKPASHTAEYLESHSRKKTVPMDKESCVVCHGRRFTCLGCH